MTSHEYDNLHDLTSNVHDDSVSGEQPPLAILTAERLGLSPRQHITSIIAGGVISGILARTNPTRCSTCARRPRPSACATPSSR